VQHPEAGVEGVVDLRIRGPREANCVRGGVVKATPADRRGKPLEGIETQESYALVAV
jgi:hypothetical protein